MAGDESIYCRRGFSVPMTFVLGIAGSPRRGGNSELLLDEFEEEETKNRRFMRGRKKD